MSPTFVCTNLIKLFNDTYYLNIYKTPNLSKSWVPEFCGGLYMIHWHRVSLFFTPHFWTTPTMFWSQISTCCWWFRNPKQLPGIYKTLVNNGIFTTKLNSFFRRISEPIDDVSTATCLSFTDFLDIHVALQHCFTPRLGWSVGVSVVVSGLGNGFPMVPKSLWILFLLNIQIKMGHVKLVFLTM